MYMWNSKTLLHIYLLAYPLTKIFTEIEVQTMHSPLVHDGDFVISLVFQVPTSLCQVQRPVYPVPPGLTAQVTPAHLSPAPPTLTVQVTPQIQSSVRMEPTPQTPQQAWSLPPTVQPVRQVRICISFGFFMMRHYFK